MVRLVVLWCPALSREGAKGEEPRRFADVLDATVELAPFARPVRLGVLAIPSKGPSRFFGGEAAFAEHLATLVGPLVGGAGRVCVGAAEGLFAAVLAARASVLVPAGTTQEFLAPWSVATLRDPDLAAACQRLGLHTLGRFARLEEARVLERFGLDAVRRHRVARGVDGELPGLRDTAALRRLDAVRHRDEPREVQRGFFGERGGRDLRAAATAQRLEQQLGSGAVTVARLGGGRMPDDRAALVPWGSADADRSRREQAAPWPGRLPAPSPAAIPSRALAVALLDAQGARVAVSSGGLLSAAPVRLELDAGRPRAVTGYCGPWPMAERWWSTSRRRAHLQVLLDDGLAVLLRAERSRWWLSGIYD
ncbi:MAG TPA: hypothetical protein VIE15_04325 [Acidimicrobiales bacterium]|jgi:hypothetical protein